MPWINQDMCTGCGVCFDYCPTGAISRGKNGTAIIDDDKCIRCGKCHNACPREAVRHDSEKIPELVEQNIAKTFSLLKNYNESEERQKFVKRMVRHFNMQKKVAEKTIEKLNGFDKSDIDRMDADCD